MLVSGAAIPGRVGCAQHTAFPVTMAVRPYIYIMRIAYFFLCLLLSATSAVWATDKAIGTPSPPTRTDKGGVQAPVPEVTIIHRSKGLVEEYRINGRLYMIKVVPKKGIPYFLVDSDGDGNFDRRENELDPELLIPSWTLFRW